MEKQKTWQIITAIIGCLLIISVFTSGFKFKGGLSSNEVSDKVMSYIKSLPNIGNVVLNDVADEGDVYKLDMTISGQKAQLYVSKDGNLLFPTWIPLTGTVATNQGGETQQGEETQVTEVPKLDKPKIELFVMSHCPYGTQAEKGLIPVLNLLGNKIDWSINFVYYAIHGEKEVLEQLNQYCIQKEQKDKYLAYLTCFLENGDGTSCLTKTRIDTNKWNTCKEKTDNEFEVTKNLKDESLWLNGKYPLFNVDKTLNDKYNIGGSPTFIVNGVSVNSQRDSASYLSVICKAFNNAPAECSREVSSQAPSPGFGYSTSGTSDSGAQCS